MPRFGRLAALVDGVEEDLPSGEKLVGRFRPFLEELVTSGLSPKTIQKHVDNLWALGGEIIRNLHEDLKTLLSEGKALNRFSTAGSTRKAAR